MTRREQADSVSSNEGLRRTSSPVGQTVVDTVAGELLGARSSKDKVALKAGVDNLDDNFTVREADHEAVLRRVATVMSDPRRRPELLVDVLLVLRLGHQPLARVV